MTQPLTKQQIEANLQTKVDEARLVLLDKIIDSAKQSGYQYAGCINELVSAYKSLSTKANNFYPNIVNI